ncbi:hypothetical protein CL638_00140 [bacterium]|nr:hypothetical protein [bacterium]
MSFGSTLAVGFLYMFKKEIKETTIYEIKEILYVAYHFVIVMLAVIGAVSLFNLTVWFAVSIGLIIGGTAFQIEHYFRSPKYMIARLWAEVLDDTILLKKLDNGVYSGGLTSTLKERNEIRGRLINSLLTYHYSEDEEQEEYVSDNQYE